MSFMIAFGIASILLCIGMIIRSKVSFIKNMLVPASVIAGILGMIIMNTNLISATDAEMFTIIVTQLFTITFISIGLTSNSSKETSAGKQIVRGSIGLGLLWNLLYALTPVVGVLVILLIGSSFGMDALYGLLIPFAFTQGPGQAATFGSIFEQQYGIENAAMVGLTFAAVGFIACFLVGVPIAKYGLKRGLSKQLGESKIKDYVKRGYYTKDEKREPIGHETVFSGNMDTMTFHFAMIGICYVLALGMAHVVSYIPGIGESLSGMLFIHGMIAGYFVKMILNRLKLAHLLDNTFQTKITGWSTDYLVVCSFMAVQFSIIG
ncbi:sodium/glutamate symporter [Oceanobacillus timonensis]|uniref:sodium/glutamate symporter n=1 Tax=Oceanobacillus timonensis TaxID=1926285 RepID=UPI001FE5B0ED|nr:sodium/glutamate symporter [Oceanobacillus timonensis]